MWLTPASVYRVDGTLVESYSSPVMYVCIASALSNFFNTVLEGERGGRVSTGYPEVSQHTPDTHNEHDIPEFWDAPVGGVEAKVVEGSLVEEASGKVKGWQHAIQARDEGVQLWPGRTDAQELVAL